MNVKTQTLGTIISFDPKTQYATVKLSCNGTNSTLDVNYFNQEGLTIIDVLVEMPRCGDFVITMPIKPGDDCIVSFFEQGITHWKKHNLRAYRVTNGRPEPAARRRYDRQDAVCRVVVDNEANIIPGYNGDGLEVRSRSGNQKMIFHPNGVIEVISPADLKFKAAGNVTIDAGGDYAVNAKNVSTTATASNTMKGVNVALKGQGISMEQ